MGFLLAAAKVPALKIKTTRMNSDKRSDAFFFRKYLFISITPMFDFKHL
jgi:hypothetical protein